MGGCWWQGCVTPGTPCCPTARRFQPASAHHHLPSVIRKQELPQAVIGCSPACAREQGRGTATPCVPSPPQLENPPGSSDGLCRPSRSLDPIPALRMAAAPCAWCHVPGTKDSVTKAGGCAHCRRPPPLQGLHLLWPGPSAGFLAQLPACSAMPHVSCSAAAVGPCPGCRLWAGNHSQLYHCKGAGLMTPRKVCPKSGSAW